MGFQHIKHFQNSTESTRASALLISSSSSLASIANPASTSSLACSIFCWFECQLNFLLLISTPIFSILPVSSTFCLFNRCLTVSVFMLYLLKLVPYGTKLFYCPFYG